MYDKLNAVFTEEFINANSNIDSVDVLFEKVVEVDSSITREEFEDYLSKVKIIGAEDTLEEEDLENVAGGFAIATVVSCITVGAAIGEAIYYWQQNKKKKK